MIEQLYQRFNSFAHFIGIDFRRFPTRDQKRVINYLKEQNIDNCVDVGANKGQFVSSFRSMGFKGNIFSFEPQTEVFNKLKKKAKGDAHWKVFNYAAGEAEEVAEINISKNTYSSSILDILPAHTNASPESAFTGKETITIKRLDEVLPPLLGNKKFYLKIDTQGFESKVLNGCNSIMSQVAGIQLEMPCVPLYKDEVLFDQMKQRIESYGFFYFLC